MSPELSKLLAGFDAGLTRLTTIVERMEQREEDAEAIRIPAAEIERLVNRP